MKIVDKILSAIETLFSWIVVALFVGMIFSLSTQVVARYVFNTGFRWTEESARYMMVWMIFAGSVLVSKRDIHINVNALEEMVPKTVKPLKVIQRVITAIYASMVMYFGVQVLRIAAFQTSPNMKIRMNIIYSIYPIAMAFILLFTLYHLFKSFKKKKEDQR